MTRYKNMVSMTIMALVAVLVMGIAVVQAADKDNDTAAAPGQVGSVVDDFTLVDTAGNEHSLSDYLAEHDGVIIEWFNPDCPYVKKYHAGPNPSMGEAFEFTADKDFVWLAINSGAPGKQGHGLERNKQAQADYGIDYPILIDENGTVGRSFGASSTPQVFLIGEGRTVLYNGGVDDTKLNTDTPGVNYVINALTQFMADQTIYPAMTNHPGCSVKYAK